MRHLFGELVRNVDDDSIWNEYEQANAATKPRQLTVQLA